MEEYFNSSRALIERARENLDEFNRRTIAFFVANPYSRFERLDPTTGEYCHVISMVATFEPSVTVVAFDVVNNLRSALDHAVYASAEALGHTNLRHTKFPFGDNEQSAERDAKGCHPEEAMQSYLLSFKPHKDVGGDDLLWGLNQLRNIKNHRRLLTPRFDVNNITISHGTFTSSLRPCSEWNAAGTELTYLRSGKPGETGYDLSVAPRVKFSDIPVLKDVHAPGMFNKLADDIAGIIAGVEQETARILLQRNP